MRLAKVENGIVVSIIIGELTKFSEHVSGELANVGDSYNATTEIFTAPIDDVQNSATMKINVKITSAIVTDAAPKRKRTNR